MARVCMRPGCDRDAAARLTYDTISCQVWLDGVAERQGPNQEICVLHAERLTVPRGWMLCDRRRVEPTLYVAASSGSPATTIERPADDHVERPPSGRPGRRRSAARRDRSAAARALELFDDVTEPEVSLAPEPDAPVGVPETPVPEVLVPDGMEPDVVVAVAVEDDTAVTAEAERTAPAAPAARRRNADDDLPESLKATSPLLARAFAATGHQRSVLTQSCESADEDAVDD